MASEPPLPLEEAQARLLALATRLTPTLPIERVDIEGSIGRYLAEPVYARRTQPAADLSAMDGYAVPSHDLSGPWHVIGESAAGHPYDGTVRAGQAVRISTGAILPDGTQAVIVQEDMARADHQVELTGIAPDPHYQHVRPCGMDFAEGKQVLDAGTRIGPAQAALAIAAGHKHLPVRRNVRVTIIDSGDELAGDPENCPSHQIPASNGAMLLAMVRDLPVDATLIGPVADTMDALAAAFAACEDADVIVTSGGASVGDHDLVRPAMEAWGASIAFWRVAIKPGKPLLVATRGRRGRTQIVLGLPGNPASSLVTAFHFLLPLLRSMLGAAAPMAMPIRTHLGAPAPANGGRRAFLRGAWNGREIVPQALQDSGALASLAASNALIDRPSNAPSAQAGDEVTIYLLGNDGIA